MTSPSLEAPGFNASCSSFARTRRGIYISKKTSRFEFIICSGTRGTEYNRHLGLNGGIATFTVEVPSAGGYALNVAYVTKVTRNVSVKVINGEVQKFEFDSSGEWCFNGGSSTVLRIELEGFIVGTNTITFGADMAESHPLIEWISLVA